MDPLLVILSNTHSISAMVYYEIILRFIGVEMRSRIGSHKTKRRRLVVELRRKKNGGKILERSVEVKGITYYNRGRINFISMSIKKILKREQGSSLCASTIWKQ